MSVIPRKETPIWHCSLVGRAVHINKLAYTKCHFPLAMATSLYGIRNCFHICRKCCQTKRWMKKAQAFACKAHNPPCYLVDYDLQVAEEKANCKEVWKQTKEEKFEVKDVMQFNQTS